jgi:hypothetical protein
MAFLTGGKRNDNRLLSGTWRNGRQPFVVSEAIKRARRIEAASKARRAAQSLVDEDFWVGVSAVGLFSC